MAKKANSDDADSTASLVTTPEDQSKAKKWFARARELGDKRQFDYAIEYYVNGLEFWPDAVEEACKPLHGCAVARKQTGGKKPGLKDTMRRSQSDKDAKKAFLNTAWLFGRERQVLVLMNVLRGSLLCRHGEQLSLLCQPYTCTLTAVRMGFQL